MTSEDGVDSHFWDAVHLMDDDDIVHALAHVNTLLALEPDNVQGLMLAGEIHLLYHDELSIETGEASRLAMGYFRRVTSRLPGHAEAWGAIALSHLYLNESALAVEAADRGLASLGSAIGFGMTFEPIRENVAEALYDRKIRALIELGKLDDARQALREGLSCCQGSEFLSRHIQSLMAMDL